MEEDKADISALVPKAIFIEDVAGFVGGDRFAFHVRVIECRLASLTGWYPEDPF
jgi:hypothetical protein